jgi:hypothetical protein
LAAFFFCSVQCFSSSRMFLVFMESDCHIRGALASAREVRSWDLTQTATRISICTSPKGGHAMAVIRGKMFMEILCSGQLQIMRTASVSSGHVACSPVRRGCWPIFRLRTPVPAFSPATKSRFHRHAAPAAISRIRARTARSADK